MLECNSFSVVDEMDKITLPESTFRGVQQIPFFYFTHNCLNFWLAKLEVLEGFINCDINSQSCKLVYNFNLID